MNSNGNVADFREMKHIAIEFGGGTISGVGEGAVTPKSLEPRETGFPSRLHAAEEVAVGSLKSSQAVLQDLGVDTSQYRSLLLESRQTVGLLTIREAFAFVLVSVDAFCKGIVVQMTARFEGVLKKTLLLFCGIYPVLKCSLYSLTLSDKHLLCQV